MIVIFRYLLCGKFKGLYPVRRGSFLLLLWPPGKEPPPFLVSSKENCFWKKNPSALLVLFASQNDDVWCCWWWYRKELWLVQRERRLVNAEKEFISEDCAEKMSCNKKSIPIRYSTQLEYIFLWIRLRSTRAKQNIYDFSVRRLFCLLYVEIQTENPARFN